MVIGTPTVLNLIPGGVMKIIHVNQVNENIEIQFRIMNGAQPFNVPEGVSCTIRGTKGDNFGYAAAVAVTAGSNIVTVTLTEQLTAVAGAGNIFELVFVGASDDMKVSTENFILAVERAALGEDTVISDSDLAYADQVLDQLQSVGAVNAQVQQNTANIAAETTRATAAEAAEASARQAADQTLQQNINAEAAARQAADNTLQSNINAEASSRATTDASLQAQIDQLIAPSGSAPSAAEVENARIGSDGTVYPTLGDAIRTQNSDLKSQIDSQYTAEPDPSWEFSATNDSGVYYVSSTKVDMSFRELIPCNAGDTFVFLNPLSNNAWIIIHRYTGSTYIGKTSTLVPPGATNTRIVPADGLYRIQIAKQYGVASTDAELEDVADSVTINALRIAVAEQDILQGQANLNTFENLIIDSSETIEQFLLSTAWISDSLWHNSGSSGWTDVGTASLTGYHRYPALHLSAGTYGITKIYAVDSYIKYDNNTISRFSDLFPETGTPNSYAKVFTVAQGFTIYITVKDADSSVASTMLINSNFIPTVYKDKGVYQATLNDSLYIGEHTLQDVDAFISGETDGTWINKYIYAYIHDSVLLGNSNYGAKYTQADMGSLCQKMMCRYKLREDAHGNKGCVTLITIVNRGITDSEPVNDIGVASVHVVFTPVNAQIGIFDNHVLDVFETISYNELLANETTEYECGIEFLGSNQLKVYLPNGTSQTVTDSRIDAHNGQYVVWEHYTQNYSAENYPTITEQMAQPLITGFYCKCASNVELRDNFKRQNGAVGNAPSGQVYRTWVNRKAGSTIYDNV